MEKIKILCFCWNTQSIRLGETFDQNVIDNNRNGFWFMKTKYHYDVEVVDFLPDLIEKILDYDCDLVVFSFQEDAYPGSYFHSDLLPIIMFENDYELLERDKLMGFGKTSLKSFYNKELLMRGLRTSIYVKSEFRQQNECINNVYKLFYNPNYSQNKGGIGFTIQLPNDELLTIVNTHLPFDSSSVINSVNMKDYTLRQDALSVSNFFFNELVRNVVPKESNYIFIMGDLNYRIKPFIDWSAKKTGRYILKASYNDLKKQDEFYIQMKNNFIYKFKEGVNNEGPSFQPTCKLLKTRRDEETEVSIKYNLGKYDQRVPSFCDRIIYRYNHGSIKCHKYKSYDKGIIKKSDHCSIYGVYEIN